MKVKPNKKLLAEFSFGRCEWCGKAGPTDPHHIFGRGMAGGKRMDLRITLISLCRACHKHFHDGHIEQTDLLAVASAREGCQQRDIEAVVRFFRRLPKDPLPCQLEMELKRLGRTAKVLAKKCLEEMP